MRPAATDAHVLQGPVSLWRWQTPGPVATRYLSSTSPIVLIMGPAGSGKTVTSVVKCALQTLRMPPCADGVIRARGCVVRDNFRTLYRTTLETWFRVFPKDFPGSKFEGGQDRPAKHTITFRTPQGQLVEMVVDFFAVGDHAIEDLLKGYEPTWAWGNEADLLAPNVLPFLYGRTGRYPSRLELADPAASVPRQVFADINPPSVDHFIYENCKDKKVDGWELLEQPSGLSDEAENRIGVPREVYEQNARTMGERDVIRFVHGRFGYSNDGRPVYPDFDQQRVFADQTLDVLPHTPLCAGLDQGLKPAIVFFQIAPSGQVRVLAEVVPPADQGTGPARFSQMILPVLTSERFRGLPMGGWYADPAGFTGVDRQNGEMSWVETIEKALGVRILPSPSQDMGLRIDALRMPMMTDLSQGQKFLIIDPSCRMVRGGLGANYKFPLQKQAGREIRSDTPLKNEWSHPCEALQYGVLGVRGRAGIIQEAARAGRPGNVVPIHAAGLASSDFNVWGV